MPGRNLTGADNDTCANAESEPIALLCFDACAHGGQLQAHAPSL